MFRFASYPVLLIFLCFSLSLSAQDRPPAFEREAVRNVEKFLDSKGQQSIRKFIQGSMVELSDREEEALVEKLSMIRQEMRGLRDDIMVEGEADGIRLILAGGGKERALKILLDIKKKAIADLILLEVSEPMPLSVGNLTETFDRLEQEGMSGVVYIRIDGELLLERAFGFAHRELQIPNTLEHIFGTGSRPIDYTVAAILLLDQRGRLELDDPITRYFDAVPEDKQSITIRHLLNGQSGLPDFFHTEEDWDPDLAWVDRKTAVKRLMEQELLFEPGSEQRHSHAAFGLLAALVERITDNSYYGFLRENFLDPAGMKRTGEYGESRGLAQSDFAEGGGPQKMGLPNIPPNWGPTSWLIKGSGGMYSTLGDLRCFYSYLRSGKVLDEAHMRIFQQPAVSLDGSDRGFELFSAYFPPDSEIYLFLNEQGNRDRMRQLFRALEGLLESESQANPEHI